MTPTPRRSPTTCRLGLAGLAVLALSLSTASTGSASVHDWLFDPDGSSVVNTRSEAVTVAHRYDVVIAGPRYHQYLGAMRAAHRGIVIAPYHKGTAVQGRQFLWMKAHHPRWLLHTAGGGLLKSSWGTYLIDPANLGVRKWQADFARRAVRNGWNGIFLDSMGLYAFNGFTGTPINPRTGNPFTSAGWLKATTGLAKAVNAAVPVRVMVNGLRTGPGYWKGTRVLLAGAQAGEFEGCFRDATSGISRFPSLDGWKATVKALADIQARGRHAMCWTKTWTTATSAQIQQWHDFALASFLLGAWGQKQYFFFSGSRRDTALTWYGDGRYTLGKPVSAIKHVGSIWKRRFANGVVVVNPTGTADTISFTNTYLLPSGRVASSSTLDPHTGLILLAP
jgi:putative glycosyl hydrolase-like family 15 (GHL15) protein